MVANEFEELKILQIFQFICNIVFPFQGKTMVSLAMHRETFFLFLIKNNGFFSKERVFLETLVSVA